MNKRERMQNALLQKHVDRVPVGFWHHFTGEEAQGQHCIDAQIEFYRNADLDFIKIMSDGYFEYPLPPISRPEDWFALEPLSKEHPYIEGQLQRARGICDALKHECMVFYTVFAPFSSIRFGSSDALVTAHLAQNAPAVLHALSAIAKTNALLAELLITQSGCDGVYYCMQGGEQNRFTPDAYRRLIAPSDRFVLDHANAFSQSNLIHLCGWDGIKNHLELWKDYSGAAVNWAVFVEEMSLNEGRTYFGGRPVMGGFDNRAGSLLLAGSKADIQAYTRRLIQDTGARGFIIGADCSLPDTIDSQRLRWVVEAAETVS